MGAAETGPVRRGAARAAEAGPVRTGAARGGAPAVTVPVILVASAFGTSALTLHARELASTLAVTMPLRSSDLPDVVALALALVGAAVAGWYLLSALTAASLLLARGGGRATTRLQAWLARWGAPALRRAFATTAVASLGLGAAVSTSAMAAPTDGSPMTVEVPGPSAEQVDPLPADLGWGAPAPSERPDEHVPAPSSTTAAPVETPGARAWSTPAPSATNAPGATSAVPRTSDPGRPAELVGPAPTSAPRPDEAPSATTETTVGSPVPPDPAVPSTGAPVAGTAAAPPATPGAQTSADRGRPSVPGPAPDADTPTATRDGQGAHLVRAGDSLWTIAAGHLGAGASDAEVAAAWPHWYRENVATVGPDPDLIHPGQLLQAPTEEIP